MGDLTRLVNLAPNPKILTTSQYVPTIRWDTRLRDTDDGLELYADEYPTRHLGVQFGANPDLAFSGAHGSIPIPRAGDYVVNIHVMVSDGEPANIVTRGRCSDGSDFLDTQYSILRMVSSVADADITRNFTAPFACDLNFVVETERQMTRPMVLSRLIVCSKQDWKKLQSSGMPYFDGSTMPDPRGGGVFLLAFLLLSSALCGGWRHERAVSDSQSVPGSQDEDYSIEAFLHGLQAGVLDQRVRAGVGHISGTDARSHQGRGQLGRGEHPASRQREARARVRVLRSGDIERAVDVGMEFGRQHLSRVHVARGERSERGVHGPVERSGQGHVPSSENHRREDRDVQRVHRLPGRLPDTGGHRDARVPGRGSDARPAGLTLGVAA